MSRKSIGKVLSLFISVQGTSQRVQKKSIVLDKNGIIEDKFYHKAIERSVLITSLSSYSLAEAQGILMPHASLGENLLIDFMPYNLPEGSILHIGDSELHITQKCTLCDHLSSIDKRLPTLLKNDRGIFAKVTKEGAIQEGDTIYLTKR